MHVLVSIQLHTQEVSLLDFWGSLSLSLFAGLFFLILSTVDSSHLSLPTRTAPSPNTESLLSSYWIFLPWLGKFEGSRWQHSLCSPFLFPISQLPLSFIVWCLVSWKLLFCFKYTLNFFGNCFSWEGKFSPYYSTLTENGNISSYFKVTFGVNDL